MKKGVDVIGNYTKHSDDNIFNNRVNYCIEDKAKEKKHIIFFFELYVLFIFKFIIISIGLSISFSKCLCIDSKFLCIILLIYFLIAQLIVHNDLKYIRNIKGVYMENEIRNYIENNYKDYSIIYKNASWLLGYDEQSRIKIRREK